MSRDIEGQIISLTYHEITEDARVLKEARALSAAGFQLHIFCDWPEGKPQVDNIEGIHIRRFHCFGPEAVCRADFESMTFLKESRELVAEKFLPYADACEVMSQLKPYMREVFGHDFEKRMYSSYFKRSKGFERYSRLISYLWINLRLSMGAFGRNVSNERANPIGVRGNTRESTKDFRQIIQDSYRNVKAHHRALFQVQSIPYWCNLRRLPMPRQVVAIHAHDIYCLPAGVMLSQQLNAPLVYDAHEYEPSRASKMGENSSELAELIEDDCFPFVDRIITVSEGLRDLYAGRFLGPNPTIVANAPDVEISQTRSELTSEAGLLDVREKAGLPKETPLVVFTGGIQREHRGMDKVLAAMKDLPDVHLVVLGPRHDADDKWFLTIARSLDVMERVTLLPPVDARDVPAAISTADVAICPIQDVSLSYRHSMPNKLFEAAFANIPICVSNLPEMRRFVEVLGIGRAMDQTDPSAIADAIREILNNPVAYRMTDDAARALEERYSWKKQSKELVKLFSDLTRKSHESTDRSS